jgi:hypothetical protein
MRRRSWIAGVLAVALIPAAVATAGTSSRVYVAGDCAHGQFKPKVVIITCGDAGAFVQKLTWSSWTTAAARGQGTYKVNSCTPNCAAGHFKSSAVKVKLSKPGSCSHHTHRFFKRMTLTFRSGKAMSFRIFCPT